MGKAFVIGSSVVKGWKAHDPSGWLNNNRGYAQRLEDYMGAVLALEEPLDKSVNPGKKGFQESGSSTGDFLCTPPGPCDARHDAVIAELVKYQRLMVIGLSLGNEGLSTTLTATEASDISVTFKNGLRELVELAAQYATPVVIMGVYPDSSLTLTEHTKQLYATNAELVNEVPTWTRSPKYVDWLSELARCSDPNQVLCGHWKPRYKHADSDNHPNGYGFTAMYRAINLRATFDDYACGKYATNAPIYGFLDEGMGRCSGAIPMTTYSGDTNIGHDYYTQNKQACRNACVKEDTACGGYAFHNNGTTQANGAGEVYQSEGRECVLYNAGSVTGDGTAGLQCYQMGIANPPLPPSSPSPLPNPPPSPPPQCVSTEVGMNSGWTCNVGACRTALVNGGKGCAVTVNDNLYFRGVDSRKVLNGSRNTDGDV